MKSRLAKAPLATLVRRAAIVGAVVGVAMLSAASGVWGASGDTSRIDGVCPDDGAPYIDYAISRTGRFVVAECTTRRVPDPSELYERDRLRRRTVLVSRAAGPDGRRGEGGGSQQPSVSDDGQVVAFASDAENLAPGTSHQDRHVFVRDLRRNTTTLIDGARQSAGSKNPGTADELALSPDGRFLAYDDWSGEEDQVYVRDLRTNKTTLVSRATGTRGAKAQGSSESNGSFSPSISADGRRVAFESDATNLASHDRNNATDVFVRDLRAHTTTLVSRSSGARGVIGNGYSSEALISSDGRSVAFDSRASNLANGIPPLDNTEGTHLWDGVVYVRNLSALTTQLVSRATGPDGAAATFFTRVGSISGDGRLVAFNTSVPGPRPCCQQADVWVRDLTTQTTTLASRASGEDGAQGNASSAEGLLTADGRMVVFRSIATNLTPDPAPSSRGGLFARELGVPPR